jgi:hypothetical protein
MCVAKKYSIQEAMKKCPKGREVSNPECSIPCETKYNGDELLVECLAKNPHACKFSWLIGHFYMCRCPHYPHIPKELKK